MDLAFRVLTYFFGLCNNDPFHWFLVHYLESQHLISENIFTFQKSHSTFQKPANQKILRSTFHIPHSFWASPQQMDYIVQQGSYECPPGYMNIINENSCEEAAYNLNMTMHVSSNRQDPLGCWLYSPDLYNIDKYLLFNPRGIKDSNRFFRHTVCKKIGN